MLLDRPQLIEMREAVVPAPRAPADPRGAVVCTPEKAAASAPLADIVDEIVLLQRRRRFCIKSQSRNDRSCEAFIARFLGYSTDMDEKQGKEVWKQAMAVRKAVEAGRTPKGLGAAALDAVTPIVLGSAASRAVWDAHREQTEKRMRDLARKLPAWSFVDGVKGFGALGLAIVVGEAGDIGAYPKKGHLWKRLGLAVIDGERQRRKTGAEAAAAHGYNPQRRAEMWTLADSLFKHQWAGAKDDGTAAHAKGPYGEVYARRKASTEGREGWTDAHRDADARRIMMKQMLKHLRQHWRAAVAAA